MMHNLHEEMSRVMIACGARQAVILLRNSLFDRARHHDELGNKRAAAEYFTHAEALTEVLSTTQ